ncbi:hypothetical protein D3C86_1986860 [compost metagenome]
MRVPVNGAPQVGPAILYGWIVFRRIELSVDMVTFGSVSDDAGSKGRTCKTATPFSGDDEYPTPATGAIYGGIAN